MDQITPPTDPDTTRRLRDALGRYATGITVVTAMADRGPIGITVNSFTSVSMDPPLILWCPARGSERFAALSTARHYAIHILHRDQTEICHRFARSGDDFEGLDWRPTLDGAPAFSDCLARFDCLSHAVYDGGDHAILVGRVLRACIGDGDPLVFWNGHYGGFSRSSMPQPDA